MSGPQYQTFSMPRYPKGAAHPGIEAAIVKETATYQKWMSRVATYVPQLSAIANEEPREQQPSFDNRYLPPLDAAALYTMLSHHNPARYLEVGSGNSTLFARRAIRDQGLRTKITSIDPTPRREIDLICDEVIRNPLEKVDLTIFSELEENDVLFIDGSHRALMNSDVVVYFLEILPQLKPGVLIQIHDIFWPWDYPEHWKDWQFNEQYLLGTLIAHGLPGYRIQMPNAYIASQPELMGLLDSLWQSSPLWKKVGRGGGSFWLQRC